MSSKLKSRNLRYLTTEGQQLLIGEINGQEVMLSSTGRGYAFAIKQN